MLVAMHQPEHLPWIGFFEKMIRADLFVLLDDVQFSRGDFQNRNRVKGPASVQWLTVPIIHKFPQRLDAVEIAGNSWQDTHWKTLASCYGRARYFKEFAFMFEDLYRRSWTNLVTLNISAVKLLASVFGIDTPIILSSQLEPRGQKSDLILDICNRVGATSYYSGRTGSTYLNREAFRNAGIDILVQRFEHPTYSQRFMKSHGFVPNLSVIDLLFNCGDRGLDSLSGAPEICAEASLGVLTG
jgi:WbqC-like protein family